MNFKKLFKAYLIIVLAITGFNQSVMAKDEAMICAVTQAVSCQKGGDCQSGSADELNLPLFLKIIPDKNEIVSRKENGETKTSIIKQTTRDKDNRFVIYQGVEQGGAWSTVVDKTTGSMTISIAAGENDAYIIYGACSISLLKP